MKKLLRSSILYLVIAAILAVSSLLLWWYAVLDVVGCGLVLLLTFGLFVPAILLAGKQPQPEAALEVSLSGAMEERLKAADFSRKNVMVGTVRTEEQLRYCLEQNKYYAPAKFFLDAPFPLDRIALHEEEIGTQPGIRWIGQIKSVELIERQKIPVSMRPDAEPDESYYHFTVESWQQRRPAITILGSRRGRPRFTTEFLLDSCTKSYQLFAVQGESDYRLMCIIDKVHEQLCADHALSHAYRLSKTYILMAKDGNLLVVNSGGWVQAKIPFSSFAADPAGAFFLIRNLLHK